MNKYLENKYALLGKTADKGETFGSRVKKLFKNSTLHYLFFLLLIWVVGYLSIEKILPRSFQSAFAITFSYSIAAVGFCLLMGYSGLASLGTGGFIGVGTYSVYYVVQLMRMRFAVAIVVALLVAAIIGIIVGFISLRIEGIYLVILTLGLSEILRNLYMVVQDRINIKNFPILTGFVLKKEHAIYIVGLALVVIMMLTHNLINSPTGRAMLAMKNSTAAAQAMGISLLKYRLLAFVICTMYASLAGVMLMISQRSAMASDGNGFYALITSLNILAAVIIGGYKSIWGAVFGSFVMYGMQTVVLSRVKFLQENPVIITFVSGILVILVVMFYPGGLAQLLVELKGKIKKLRLKRREVRYGKDLG